VKTPKKTLLGERLHLHASGGKVSDLAAASTNQVVVLAFVRFDANGTVMHAHLSQHAALEEGPHILIHRRQGDGGNPFLYRFVDPFGAGMALQRHYSLVNDSPLMRGSQAMLAAQGAKLSSAYH
jgi:hypothetical protein